MDGLLAAILERPDDDTRRLVYADWLSEHGQPERGEFIRVLCRAERCSPCRDCSVWSRRDCPEPECVFGLHDRALTLLLDGNWAPTKGLCQYIAGGGPGETREGMFWRRGFVAAVRSPADVFMRLATGVFRGHPVESVEITDRRPNRLVAHATGFTWNPTPESDPFEVGNHPRPHYWQPSDPPHCLPFELYALVMQVRDKNVAGDDADCARWLSAASLVYGREAAKPAGVA